MSRKSFFILVIVNTLLVLTPLSPGSNFNGFIVVSILLLAYPLIPKENQTAISGSIGNRSIFIDHDGYLNLDDFSLGRYYTNLLLIVIILVTVSYFNYQVDVIPAVEDAKIMLYLERPVNLLLLGGVLQQIYQRYLIRFNLGNLLIITTLFNYFYSSLLEFILEFHFGVPYYQFTLPFGDFEEMLKQITLSMQSGVIPQEVPDNLYQETVDQMVNIFTQHMNVLVSTFNLFFFLFLVRGFSNWNWSLPKPHFNLRWMRFPNLLVAPFLFGWMLFFIDYEPDTTNQVAVFHLMNFFKTLTFLVGALYFIQGIGISIFLLQRMLIRLSDRLYLKYLIFAGMFLILMLQPHLFIMMLVFFNLSIGVMDQWINYRKI